MTKAPIAVPAVLAVIFGAACGGSAPPPASPTPVAAAPAATASPLAEPAALVTASGHAPKAPVPLEEYLNIRRVGSRSGILLSFSHDEKLVAYLSDEGGRTDVW